MPTQKRGPATPRKTRSVTVSALERLGAQRLAELLCEASRNDLQLRRRLRYELAGESGVEQVAADLGKRLLSLQRARSFVDWQKRRAFVKDLDLLRQMILDKVAPQRPAIALDLLWRFLALAAPTFERVDDSYGEVGEVLRTACQDVGTVAVPASLDPIRLADRVFEALTANDYGQYDSLIAAVFPALGVTGAQHLKQQLTTAVQRSDPQKTERGWSGTWKRALQDLADQQGDVDAYIAQEREADRQIPEVAAAIAQRLLATDRNQEALEILRKARPKHKAPSREEIEEDLRYGAGEIGSSTWSEAWVKALLANERIDEAQQFRWRQFERSLDVKSLRAYLQVLPGHDDLEAEQKAIQYALTFSHFDMALRFLIDWPDHHEAAGLVLTRRTELDGNLYFLLEPAAQALTDRYPHVATLLYRAMLEDTLKGAKSTRYGHAARHLLTCEGLQYRIPEDAALERHAVFRARLQKTHARKTGFWSRVRELEQM
jgi:hypothetical protein